MRILWLLALAAVGAGGAQLYPPMDVAGPERLTNGGFRFAEDNAGAADRGISGWEAYQDGYEPAPGQGRDGDAIVCRRESLTPPGNGAAQSVRLDQDRPRPIVVRGWSRCENVTAAEPRDYSIYCDLLYDDGTPLWGRITPFNSGSHDWEEQEVVIWPTRPVAQITVYALFRNSTGTVWFDDFSLTEVTPPAGAAPLDGVNVVAAPAPARGEPQTLSAGPLTLELRGQRVARTLLDGRDVGSPSPGGFLARDAASDGGFHGFDDGGCEALGLALEADWQSDGERIVCSGQVRDTTGRDRAVTLVFALPLDAIGWRWGHDITRASTIAAEERYADTSDIGVGANGQLSRYPLANVSGPAGGINLAIDMRRPAHYRLGYSGGLRLLTLSFDFGLTPINERFPSAAPFWFELFPSNGEWGFRAGLQRYYDLHPESFELRTPDQGNWMAFAKISEVEGWEDFGFKFKEGDNETAWDDAHDILTFRYHEMGTFWMPMPPEMPRAYDAAYAELQRLAAGAEAWRTRLAQATLTSGMHDATGRIPILFRDEPWCDGGVWSLNPSPYVEGDVTQADLAWSEAMQAAYAPGATPALDGEYLDSLEGYVTAELNYRRDHLATAKFPPTFTRDGRPVLHKGFSIAEFVEHLCDDLHARGRLTFANGVPYRFGFMCAWLDIMGTETNWMWDGEYRPSDAASMGYRRAMAGRRPYLLLQNTQFAEFGPYVERYFQRALAYGMFPSMFSHNAAQNHYFQTPEWYNRDRALFRKYLPLIERVAEAGWRPVAGARCDNEAIVVERFGPDAGGTVYLTVHNPGDAEQAGTVTFEREHLGEQAPRTVALARYATEVIELRMEP